MCGKCFRSVCALASETELTLWSKDQVPYCQFREFWPVAARPSAPASVPENVKNFFLQGLDNLDRRNTDAAGMMFRKALEARIRTMHADGKGSLYDRIKGLPAELGVTPAMKRWAHSIRHLGNDATHEEDLFSQDDAKNIHKFTEVFLTQAFSLPARIPETVISNIG